ncbi:MAG: DUF222 domain-containing protein [Acidimicrobiia bacterium]|nr:DUF222 domain-containing protein [Acidimicrobiia bacterium]
MADEPNGDHRDACDSTTAGAHVAFDGVTPVFDGPPEQARIDELTEQLRQVAAEVSARQARMVELTAELAALANYLPGVTLRQWMTMSVGLTPAEASRCARLATRLEPLPGLSSAFAQGCLSEGIVDLCASVATPDNEDEVLNTARYASGAQLQTLVRAMKRVKRSERDAEPIPESVGTTVGDDGMWRLRAVLNPERGAEFEAALRAERDDLWDAYRDAKDAKDATDDTATQADTETAPDPGPKRPTSADALVAMARRSLAGHTTARGTLPARYQINILIDVDDLFNPDSGDDGGCGRIHGGGPVDVPTIASLLSESSIVVLLHDKGVPVLATSPEPLATTEQRHALLLRDGTCRFPGCGRTHHLRAHHLLHRADNGPTALWNLVWLCDEHHTRIHQPGWTHELDPDTRQLRFTAPDGTVVEVTGHRPAAEIHLGDPNHPQPDTRWIPSGDRLDRYGADAILTNWLDPRPKARGTPADDSS